MTWPANPGRYLYGPCVVSRVGKRRSISSRSGHAYVAAPAHAFKDRRGRVDTGSMQTIDNHLADTAPWRALLTKAQFVARVELHALVEEYLVGVLFRSSISPGAVDETILSAESGGFEQSADVDTLRTIGDHCLVYAGLYPEHAIQRDVPLAYFVRVGAAAYREFGSLTDDPMFTLLADCFVDIVGVLHTLRDIEDDAVCLDAMNAFQLWQDTGSVHAWGTLRRFTDALPVAIRSNARH